MTEVRIIGLDGIPEVRPGDDFAAMILESASNQGLEFEASDIVVITQKVISKAEGRIVDLEDIEPGEFALDVAEQWDKDPAVVEIVLRESARIVRMDHGVMICETKHGLICANAGVDASTASTRQRRRRRRRIDGIDASMASTRRRSRRVEASMHRRRRRRRRIAAATRRRGGADPPPFQNGESS